MRAPGEMVDKVTHEPERFSRWTSGRRWQVPYGWTLTHPTPAIPQRAGHDDDDISPLQLGVIRRGIDLWTNPGDVVLSPFTASAPKAS